MFFVSLWLFWRVRQCKVDVIHAHKLTTDGPLGYFLSLWSGWPLVVSVRGDTDSRFIRYKPFSHFLFRRILQRARHVFWVSAWAQQPISQRLRLRSECLQQSLLPNIVTLPAVASPAVSLSGMTDEELGTVTPTPKPATPEPTTLEPTTLEPETPESITSEPASFVFIGKLSEADKKGLWRVLEAMASLRERGVSACLDVYGAGNEAMIQQLEQRTASLQLTGSVRYLGKVSQQELSQVLPTYTALVMPSRNETFGMVYIEALFSGIPVIGCRYSGVDGYLPADTAYARQVLCEEPNALACAMNEMLQHSVALKQELHRDAQAGALDLFTKPRIAAAYVDTLCSLSASDHGASL